LGIFSIKMRGSNVEVDSESARQTNVVAKAANDTNEVVQKITSIADKRLMSEDEKARLDAFMVRWDAAMNAGTNKDKAIQKAFDDSEIRPEFITDSSKSDYWINFVYLQYAKSTATAQTADSKEHMSQDIANATTAQGVTDTNILATLKQIHATLLMQQRLLAGMSQNATVSAAQRNKNTGHYVTDDQGNSVAVLPTVITSSLKGNEKNNVEYHKRSASKIADIDLSAISDN